VSAPAWKEGRVERGEVKRALPLQPSFRSKVGEKCVGKSYERTQMAAWPCPVCTFENPADAAICTICATGQNPNPPNGGDAAPGGGGFDFGGGGGDMAPPEGQWACEVCTVLNNEEVDTCLVCAQGQNPNPQGSGDISADVLAILARNGADKCVERTWRTEGKSGNPALRRHHNLPCLPVRPLSMLPLPAHMHAPSIPCPLAGRPIAPVSQLLVGTTRHSLDPVYAPWWC
jgi:hypothetical protein